MIVSATKLFSGMWIDLLSASIAKEGEMYLGSPSLRTVIVDCLLKIFFSSRCIRCLCLHDQFQLPTEPHLPRATVNPRSEREELSPVNNKNKLRYEDLALSNPLYCLVTHDFLPSSSDPEFQRSIRVSYLSKVPQNLSNSFSGLLVLLPFFLKTSPMNVD